MKPTLYIFCGLPFSGKTTLAQEILKYRKMEFVSIDNIKFSRGFMWTEDEHMSAEEWQSIFNESYEKTKMALRTGTDVLYDSANQSRASRDKLREIAEEVGAHARVIFMNVPEETVRARWQENMKTKTRFHLPERFFNAAFDNYEPPTKDENVIVYNPDEDVDKWIENNLGI